MEDEIMILFLVQNEYGRWYYDFIFSRCEISNTV